MPCTITGFPLGKDVWTQIWNCHNSAHSRTPLRLFMKSMAPKNLFVFCLFLFFDIFGDVTEPVIWSHLVTSRVSKNIYIYIYMVLEPMWPHLWFGHIWSHLVTWVSWGVTVTFGLCFDHWPKPSNHNCLSPRVFRVERKAAAYLWAWSDGRMDVWTDGRTDGTGGRTDGLKSSFAPKEATFLLLRVSVII